VLTDDGEFTTDVVGGAISGGVGAVELGRGIETGDTAFTVAAPGRSDGTGRVVAPTAAPVIAPTVSNPIKR
jgi:hypothetical protein